MSQTDKTPINGPKMITLKDYYYACRLCPHACGINRMQGKTGICGLGDGITLAQALPHHGEEPPISGTRGAGTLFLSSCNLRCRFCQNYQISHELRGEQISREELARRMMTLQDRGCHNIEAVTPTPQLPPLIDALQLAWEAGLHLPLVYNCGGYENPEVIRLLDGIVDVYLPDFKYGNEEDALLFSGVRNYVPFALQSIKEMIAQVGCDLKVDSDEIATRGIIIRHLVLPGRLENTLQVLSLIRDHLSPAIPISLMSQYTPTPPVKDDPLLNRRVTHQEYNEVMNRALDMGFEQLFVQKVDDRDLCPDFNDGTPFQWDEGK